VRGNQARVKNADVRHSSSTVVMHRRKPASPVRNVLSYKCLGTKGYGSFWVRGKQCYGYDAMRIVRCRQVARC